MSRKRCPSCEQLVEAETAALRQQVEKFAKWITQCGVSRPDYACAMCRPRSEMLIEGFVCTYHEAVALAVPPTTGDRHE